MQSYPNCHSTQDPDNFCFVIREGAKWNGVVSPKVHIISLHSNLGDIRGDAALCGVEYVAPWHVLDGRDLNSADYNDVCSSCRKEDRKYPS